ncbi:MAG: hypothetical protein NVS2B2_38720 [Ktedonobacteraceae bacterium]
MDDFAWKRGMRYGTVIVDLETHKLIDLLPDREAESVKKWLEQHPGVDLVSRDRGGAYADGAARGAPQAQQVADRWHLCKNLGDALETYLKRKRIQIPSAPQGEQPSSTQALSREEPHVILSNSPQENQECVGKEERQNLWEQTHRLHQEGYGVRTIAKLLGIARNTVRRYLTMEDGWQAAPRPKRRSHIDPYQDYLATRWMQGHHNGNQLIREIRAQGYQGCDTQAREIITQLRKMYPDVASLPRRGPSSEPSPPLPVLSAKPKRLREEEQAELSCLLETSEEIRLVYRLLQTFLEMVRERQSERLPGWMKEARTSKVKELQSFVTGVERDYEAVQAGLSLHWSQGPVEGTVNKIKTHKRLMYGRAGFALLRQKLLHCS